jgi:hypothetical protein
MKAGEVAPTSKYEVLSSELNTTKKTKVMNFTVLIISQF